MNRIIMNWSPDNPFLTCKEFQYNVGYFFEKNEKYQIYRIIYHPEEDFFLIFLMNDNKPVMFFVGNTNDEWIPSNVGVDIYKYFDSVDVNKMLKKAIRKSKLNDLDIISKYENR